MLGVVARRWLRTAGTRGATSRVCARLRSGCWLLWFVLDCSGAPARRAPDVQMLAPALFGLALLYLWECSSSASAGAQSAAAGAARRWARHWCRAWEVLWPDFRQTFLKRGAGRLRDRLRRRACWSPWSADRVPLPQTRAAAIGQPGERRADRRHRADHGDVVRLRLASQGRGGGRRDVLPDAGQHARRTGRDRCHAARPDALLCCRANGRP